MLKAHLPAVASLMLVLAALVIAGCGRTAGTDKPKEAP